MLARNERISGKRRIARLVAVVLLVLAGEWLVPMLFGRSLLAESVPVALVFAIIFHSHLSRGETPHDIGWRLDNLGASMRVLSPLVIAACLVLAAAGWLFGNLGAYHAVNGRTGVWTMLGLLAWGIVQEHPLQGFINRRLQELLGVGPKSVFATAAIFALLHAPNAFLMAATFFAGLLISYAFQREPNILTAGVAHAVLTVALVLTVPYPELHGLRVGYYYLH